MTAPRITPLALLFLLLSLSLFSCSTYQNITGYFNTYYNAGKLFDEAVDEVNRAPQKDRDTNYFAPYTVPAPALTKFDKVIEKCSKLIQFHSQSSWVEGSILMIGKSYVYQNEPQSAIRKFKELLDNFPESDERLEAMLWYAKAEYLQKNSDEALILTKQVFPEAREKGRDDIMLLSLMLEAQIYFERDDYAQAAATNALAVEISGSNDLRSRAQFQCALSYERLGDKVKASEAYLKVQEFNPDFALQFKSRLRHGVMLSEIGEHQAALTALEELIEEQLKPEEYALADLEIANTYWAMGDSAEAFRLYDFIDSTFKRTDGSAKSYYRRGLIYEYTYNNFKLAKEFYSKVKGEFQNSEVTLPAQRKTDNFTSYFTLRSAITKYDSLLYRELHPDTVKKASADSTASDSSLALKATVNIDSAMVQSVSITDSSADSTRLVKNENVKDSADVEIAVEPPPPDIASEPALKDDFVPGRFPPGERDDRFLLNNNPNNLDSLGRKKENADTSKGLKANASLKDSTGKTNKVVSTKLSADSLRSLIAKNQFDLAGLFFLELGYPDSSLFWYWKVVNENPSSSHIPKAIYSIAEVYRAKGDSLKIDSLHSILLERYPETVYAYQVRRLRGEDVSPEKLDVVALEFAEAESLLQAGHSAEALQRLKTIAGTEKSEFAPKANYSVGWIYENILFDNDSATAWYRKLLKEYPSSVYASTAQPKLAVKDKPEDLSKYIKFKAIDPVAKPPKPNFRKPGTNPDPAQQQSQGDPRNIRDAERDEDEYDPEEGDPEEEEEEEEQADEETDDGDDGGEF